VPERGEESEAFALDAAADERRAGRRVQARIERMAGFDDRPAGLDR
jgi:hypothetical protein